MLFHKRTKKAIKYIWGAFSILIVVSMVVTYSGFTLLAGTSRPTPQDTVEVSTPEITREQGTTTGAMSEVELVPADSAPEDVTPPVQSLEFGL